MRRAARCAEAHGVKVAALLAACVAALTVLASATAATPAAYRAQVNGICAPLHPDGEDSSHGSSPLPRRRKDGQAYGIALGKLIVLQLTEDRKVEAVPVPAALRVSDDSHPDADEAARQPSAQEPHRRDGGRQRGDAEPS